MVTYVSRHNIDHGVDEEFVNEDIRYRDGRIKEMERSAKNIDLYLSSVYGVAEAMLLLDPEAARVETWESWTIAMQFYNAVFALSQAEKGEEVRYRIGHKVRTLTSPGSLSCADPSAWEKSFYLSVVCRDNVRAEALCQIPVERLRRAAEREEVQYNEFTYHWIAALQAYVNGTDDLVSELRSAMELSDPRRGAFGGDYLDLVVFPEMDVFRRLLMGDSGKFNEALVYALDSFKAYHSTEEAQSRVSGIVSPSLLAWACLAYDKAERTPGFSLEVESEYLPKHLLRRSWYGEFPV